MNAFIQKFWQQLGVALDTYWQQLTVGQSSYTERAADQPPASVVEAAEALADVDLLTPPPAPVEEAHS